MPKDITSFVMVAFGQRLTPVQMQNAVLLGFKVALTSTTHCRLLMSEGHDHGDEEGTTYCHQRLCNAAHHTCRTGDLA